MFISDSIKYVGVDDKDIDLFESQYVVPNGVSYNSYIIFDEKITIMDTVDARATDEWVKNIEEALGGKEPSYLVISHLEPDHAANIGLIAHKYPNMQLIGNAKTFQMLPQFFDEDFADRQVVVKEGDEDFADRQVVVKEGDEISLGSHSLTFVMAPMVHWPEVMVAYEKTEKILFSADGFGKFGALDSEDDEGWACEARRYYFNIVGKYGAQVQNLLKKASALDIQTICPLHGPVLKENLGYYLDLYNTWSSYEPEDEGVIVAYASIHGNTAKAAKQIADKLKAKGVEKMEVMDLSRDDMAEAVEAAFRYDKMVLACATYDGGLFPVMEDFLNHLKSKNFQKRKAALVENGSWAPLAAKKMRESLESMKNIEICENIVSIKSTVKEENVEQMDKMIDELLK